MKLCALIKVVKFCVVFFSFFFPHLEWLTCRQVLNIMVILGFMLNYALRVNLTMAIVEMVEDPKQNKEHSIAAMTVNDTQHETINGLSSASHTLALPLDNRTFHNATENVSDLFAYRWKTGPRLSLRRYNTREELHLVVVLRSYSDFMQLTAGVVNMLANLAFLLHCRCWCCCCCLLRLLLRASVNNRTNRKKSDRMLIIISTQRHKTREQDKQEQKRWTEMKRKNPIV